MRRLVLLPLVALLATTAGCGSDADEVGTGSPDGGSEGLASELEGRAFVSTDVVGHDLVAGSTITLTFDDGRMGAQAGCNSISGALSVDGSTLRWDDDPMSTMMGCEPALMDQDGWLSDLLAGGVDATLEGDDLTLVAGDVTISLVDLRVADPDQELVGTRWVLDTIIEGDAASSVPAGVEPATIELTDESTVAVFAGCNQGQATVEVADDAASATIGPLALTRMLCPEGGSELEATVVAVLDGEVALEIQGPLLTVTKGDRALVFRAG